MAVSNPTQVISGADYVTIANYYAHMRAQLTTSANYLYSAVYKIVQFDEFEPTLDLLNTFFEVYTLQTQSLNSNSAFLPAVRAINGHVLTRARDADGNSYTDDSGSGLSALDLWLDDEGIADNTIRSEWQTMSSQVGFSIDDGFII